MSQQYSVSPNSAVITNYPSLEAMIETIIDWSEIKDAGARQRMIQKLGNHSEDYVKGLYRQTPEGRALFDSLK